MDKGKTLLERLYRGEIFPAEDIVPQSKEYQAAVNKESTSICWTNTKPQSKMSTGWTCSTPMPRV